MSNQIKKSREFGPLTVREVSASKFQKEGTLTATLEQKVITTALYPSKKFGNERNDNVFDAEDFDVESQEFSYEETRIAFMLVPVGTTKEEVEAKLKNFPNARIYRVLSSKPILTSDQEWAIKNGNLTLEQVKAKQTVINPSTGEIIPDANGNLQFRATFLSTSGRKDEDLRTLIASNEAIKSNVLEERETVVESFDN